jgi:hypothetical protein
LLEKDLDLIEVHTRHGRRIAAGKAKSEAEFLRVKFGGGEDVGDREVRMVPLAIDMRVRAGSFLLG